MRPISLSKPSKYHNRKTRMGGRTFDSKLEAERWLVLHDREKRGEISDLVCQPSYDLYAYGADRRAKKVCIYRPDFEYKTMLPCQREICEDVKGCSTSLFSLKAKLFRFNYPYIELRIIKAKDVAS